MVLSLLCLLLPHRQKKINKKISDGEEDEEEYIYFLPKAHRKRRQQKDFVFLFLFLGLGMKYILTPKVLIGYAILLARAYIKYAC